jgi:(p)ppGpp synthase/HD superfamily hydrolase
MNVVEKARVFATAAHAAVKHVRKYTFEPYIVHPAEVAKIVRDAGGTDAMVAAAWLHDTVEDTGVTIETIRAEFGTEVAELVEWLTDVSKPEDGPRWLRKKMDREHTAAAPAEAQTIKLADLISNTKTIMAHDAKFAKIYLEEKRLMLTVMTKGNAVLMTEARKFIGE